MSFLVEPDTTSGKIALIHSELMPGTTIPVHSHPDSEIFYLLSGALEAYEENIGWKTFHAGQAISVTGGVKHALRNVAGESAFALAVTGKELYEFFIEISVPVDVMGAPVLPTPEQMQHMFSVAAKYGYWLGSPEENASIGINLG